MTSSLRRFGCLAISFLAAALALLPLSASALDTPNTLMAVDGMVMAHQGLFRNGTPHEGFNTFQFGSVLSAAGSQGRYKTFYFVDQSATESGGVSHNARYNSNTPDAFVSPNYLTVAPLDITSAYYPIVDRGAFGQRFDPAEYQIQVKFKPNLAGGPLPIANDAHTFNVGLDQNDGYVFDAEAGIYKRANDAFTYTVGTEAIGINDWYATAPKDAQGFATWNVPVTAANFVQRGFYYNYGDNAFRASHVVTGGGRTQNPDLTWVDTNDGLDPLSFGGGATDPSRPNSQLKTPQGVPLISFGSANSAADIGRTLSIEVKHIALTRITQNPIMARIDSNSGLTGFFGSSLSYSTAASAGTRPPINIPGDGFAYVPSTTDMISRFDQNGMTNLILNPRAPENGEGYRFFMRGAPGASTFVGTNATVNIRAKLTAPLTDAGVAQTMTVYAKDLDGNDTAAGTGADDFTYVLALNQFNTATFTTVTVPLSAFTVNTLPFGFVNTGDNSRTDFNLYEFGALVPNGGGLIRMELEYMDLRVPPANNADFNDDGFVDGDDLLIWQRGLGMTGQPNKSTGDADGNGSVDAGDLAIWRTKFGGPPATAAAGVVPEPGTAALAALGLAAAGVFRRRKA